MGLSLTGSFEINDQHDADYFANPYDPAPSWEPSNNSEPTRLTIEEVWALPFGRGNKWATLDGKMHLSAASRSTPPMKISREPWSALATSSTLAILTASH